MNSIKLKTMGIATILANKRIYNICTFYILAIILVSLAFSHRLTNSISVISLVVIVFLASYRVKFIKQAFTDPYFLSCLCFLFINILGMLYSTDPAQNFRGTSIKAGIVAIPFFFCANSCKIKVNLRHLMIAFTLCLLATTLYCILHAFTVYRQHGDSSVFFYHTLLSPFNEHAVYYSFYLLFCIIYWMEEDITIFKRLQKKISVISVLVYFFLVIILLSSKIVLGILSVYILYIILSHLIIHKQNKKNIFIIVACLSMIVATLLLTNNPVKKRFSDITNGAATLFQQQEFDAGTYFNGLQFRLLTWRFTAEILTEQKAWLLGVSAGDGQAFLRKKYVETNMYTGDGSNSGGYLLYDCHNIYLQTTLESGLAGLVSLLSIIASLLFKLIKSKSRTALIFFLFMLAFGFTESYLSRQFGVVLFTFLPLLALSASTPAHLRDLSP